MSHNGSESQQYCAVFNPAATRYLRALGPLDHQHSTVVVPVLTAALRKLPGVWHGLTFPERNAVLDCQSGARGFLVCSFSLSAGAGRELDRLVQENKLSNSNGNENFLELAINHEFHQRFETRPLSYPEEWYSQRSGSPSSLVSYLGDWGDYDRIRLRPAGQIRWRKAECEVIYLPPQSGYDAEVKSLARQNLLRAEINT